VVNGLDAMMYGVFGGLEISRRFDDVGSVDVEHESKRHTPAG
jgi:hypothetical protein